MINLDQENWMLVGLMCEHYGWPDTEENRIRMARAILSHLVATGEFVREARDGYDIIRTREEVFKSN